jgi:hypothetical protein
MLPYLDPAASIRIAIDLQGIRPQLLKTRPFSLLTEPGMAPVIANWFQQTQAARDQGLPVVLDACRNGTAVVWVGNFNLDAGLDGLQVIAMCDSAEALAWHHQVQGHWPLVTVGPFTGYMVPDREKLFVGVDDNSKRFTLAAPAWLQARSSAVPAPAPSTPIWFHLDAGKLIARYAELSGPTGDPGQVAPLLGPHWRTMRPVIDGKVWVDDHGAAPLLRSDTVASGCLPFSPVEPLALALTNVGPAIAAYTAVPLRRPTIGIPPSPDRLATFAMGLKVPEPMLHMASDPFTNLLEDSWSGDVALEIRPGMPLPKAALAVGLRPGTDGAQVLTTLAGLLGGEIQAGITPPTVSAQVMGGTLTLVAEPDRIIGAFNADPGEWPGLATATAPAAAAGQPAPAECSAMIDLPAVARIWGPLAAMVLSPDQAKAMPPLPLLIAHLPVWRAGWNATADGCRITEEGLPLFSLLVAAGSMREAMNADPVRETGNTMTAQPQPQVGAPAATKPDNF